MGISKNCGLGYNGSHNIVYEKIAMRQPSFFELDERFKKLDEIDPLIGLNKLVDWEVFRDALNKIRKK